MLSLLFTFGKLRLLHQSTGGLSKKSHGLRADIALSIPMDRNDCRRCSKRFNQKPYIVHHFDEWRNCRISEGVPEQILGGTQRFARDVERHR